MKRLQNIMIDQGLSLRGLSRLIGVSPALLSLMIRGQRTFLGKHKQNIAKVLQVEETSIVWKQ